ncbi:hypothetical protein BB559_006615 [Furculomyces boomerangus]|uniref:Signal peptidase complex subunit 2 n=1 Tax=Furculomyces boomerangus TaxID=61424 RepID=A0A2T9Y1H8_9FUNG|nr:hypothetical protein BB559_006615 [Furculomyces boomerangus]
MTVADTSNISDLKTICDEKIRFYLKRKQYKEIHFHEDVLLVAGYIGAIVCLLDFLYSYKYPFNQTIWFSYISVPIYAAATAFAYYYDRAVKKQSFYCGKNDKHTLMAISNTKKNNQHYFLTIQINKNSGSSAKSFGDYFFEDGELCSTALENEVDRLISIADVASSKKQ